MAEVLFLPDNIKINAEPGTFISDAAKSAGIEISLPCAGKGVCGKCLVHIESGSYDFENNGKISPSLAGKGYVLACKTKITGDITVELLSRLSEEKGSFNDVIEHASIDTALFPADGSTGIIRTAEITAAEPVMLDGLGDYDRFEKAFAAACGGCAVSMPLSVLRKLPAVLRENSGHVYVWYYMNNGAGCIADVKSVKDDGYGIAVDIGTTTVAVQLVNLENGKITGYKTDYNGQIRCGLDVISRISYAKKPEKLEELRKLVINNINVITHSLCAKSGISENNVIAASVAGNTTMVQLALGIIPEYIRLEPYTPAVFGTPVYTSGETGLEINGNAPVMFAPNVGSYVGGDIMAGLLCSEFAQDSENVDIFIDIGTNGEIVFGCSDFLFSCACSAGPAFEGGGIEFGMRASEGAIENIEVHDDGTCSFSVIGGGRAKGICGSGLISLVAQLFEKGIIDGRGKFDITGKFAGIETDGRRSKYIITEDGDGGMAVYITEADIDNLIRAKAAIYSALRTLLRSVEMDFDMIGTVYVAGGFGRYIDVKKAQTIGLLPLIDEEKFRFIGNSALTGAYMMLISDAHRQKAAELASKITYIDLSTEPSYMDEYVSAMFLPHTDKTLFGG